MLLSFQKPYSSKLKINVCQSSQHLQLLLSGSGLEPRLEFQPEVLDLGPVLPSGPGTEGTVVVRNPCEFPIEFYSLEFDQEYLAEEQVREELCCPSPTFWSLRALQHCHSCAREMETEARAKPGGISGVACCTGRLWRDLAALWCREEGMREMP